MGTTSNSRPRAGASHETLASVSPGLHGTTPEHPARRVDLRRRFEIEAVPWMDLIQRTALRLAGDRAEAEDLTQETMLKAYRAWPTFRSGTNARAWILTILYNTFFNLRRRQKRAARYASRIAAESRYAPVQTDPEARLLGARLERGLLRAIRSLPGQQRTILLLRALEDLSYEEISERIGIPVGTVKSRLSRARHSVRQRLAGD